MMAAVFFKFFQQASTRLKTPSEMDDTSSKGSEDGIYHRDSEERGIVLSVESEWDRDQYRFAGLYGHKYDDLVGWYEQEPGKTLLASGRIREGGKFNKIADMNPDIYRIPRGLHSIEMNGKSTLQPLDDSFFSNSDRVRLADIDGDGLGDCCVLDDGSRVDCWRKVVVKDAPEYWQKLGLRFKVNWMGDMLDDDGQTTTWSNTPSCQNGKLGDGLDVAWIYGHGDSKEDYARVHSKGEMCVYHNDGKTSISRDRSFWGKNEVIWARTWIAASLPVAFADLDGNGRTTAHLHRDDNGWESVGQIKFAELSAPIPAGQTQTATTAPTCSGWTSSRATQSQGWELV
ncbi:hypothetical protein FZEAL_6946 [Fusarium zealandicum]|uniref:Uncharacterized protein n=1 Tax=Fusarium zealandicum TaxID=1053134 RepID=A0A8H4UGU1_9HYPO|nr:hypothetical protein FZEAL_6946 [Fusarium zealandicum]